MTNLVEVTDIKSFTPFQHILQISEPLEKIDFQPHERLDVQASNIKNILTNALNVNEYRSLQNSPTIPEENLKSMYNDMAQSQLERKMQEMRGRKFEISYENAPGLDM